MDVNAIYETLAQSRGIYFERAKTWKHTQEYAKYLPPPQKSIKYDYDTNFTCNQQYSTQIIIEDIDCLDCALRENSSVLNLADDSFPGGIPEYSGAQEESIFRRTNLYMTLGLHLYPIRDGQAILSKNVCVFKASEDKNWEMIEKPIQINIISCPGIRHPMLIDGYLNETDRKRLRIKIETILQLASRSGHTKIILGALGCGAWRCPAYDVAHIFKDVLLTTFSGVFEKVIFAIKKMPPNTYIIRACPNECQKDNYDVFDEVFRAR